MHLYGLSAEIERNLISQRTKASLENVKSKGKRLGRPFSAQSKRLKLSKNTKKVKKIIGYGFNQIPNCKNHAGQTNNRIKIH